jgi:Ca-activated chloride channel family protein
MTRAASTGNLQRNDDTVNGRTELYWLFAAAAFTLALPDAVLILRRFRDLPRAATSRANSMRAERGR